MHWTDGRKVIGMIMTGAETTTLQDEGATVLAALETYIARCEDRLAYRREHGRQLSKAHLDALGELGQRLNTLRERLDAIVGPDVAKLYEEFKELRRQLDMEE